MAALRIAILGTRGIPAAYGGFETFAEELSTRLAARGHVVQVYTRRYFGSGSSALREYRGVALCELPALRHKYLETPVHALFSMIHTLRDKPDVILLCNAANSPFAWIPRLAGIPLAINVDGIERQRAKWSSLGKLWYRLGELCSVWFASRVVADAQVIAHYYRERYGCVTEVLPYGASAVVRPPGETLRRFGLRPRQYLLYVSRLEPENNALGVVQAYRNVATEFPLVIVGDAPYARDYIAKVKAAADSRVVFTGFQFGESYQELRSHCALYIQASQVGGTHPALVEGMAYGNCIIANSVPEHHEVLGDAGVYYARNDFRELAQRITELLEHPEMITAYGRLASERAEQLYRWNSIVDRYEELFQRLVAGKL